MKRLFLSLAAAASLAAPLAIAAQVDAQPRGKAYGHDYNRGRDNDRRDNDRRDNDRRDNDRRWDSRRYNGYYLNNRWYWGQPSANYYSRNDYRPGFRTWERGGYVPRGYPVYVVSDWQRYRLRPPPRGYHWVRTDNNDFILAAIATGLIAEVLANR